MSRSDRPELLDEVRRTLRADRPILDGSRRARLRDRVREATAPKKRTRTNNVWGTLALLGSVAASAVLLVWFSGRTASERAGTEPVALHPKVRWLQPPVDLRTEVHSNRARVGFTEGEGFFELAGPDRKKDLKIITPHADIELSSGRARVRVDGTLTEVEVVAGEVQVSSARGGTRRRVSPGSVWWSSLGPTIVAQDPSAKMRQADRERLRGDYPRAAEAYGQVASNEWGGPYREEAFLRWAEMLVAAGRYQEALDQLNRADTQFAAGILAPERRTLKEEVVSRKKR